MVIYLDDQKLMQLFADCPLKEFQFVDIREPFEFQQGKIAGALNIPTHTLAQHHFTDLDKEAIFYCKSGRRSRSAENLIAETGFKKIYCLEGGIEQWQRCGLSVQH